MQCDKLNNNNNFKYGVCQFFSNTSKDYEEILKTIGSGIICIDITKLNGLVDEYRNILEKYKLYTDCSQERICKLCEGLQMRIKLLKKNIDKYE